MIACTATFRFLASCDRLENNVVVSHIQRIGCQPQKTTSHGSQSRSWFAEQGKENKRKCLAADPPQPPTLLVRRKKQTNKQNVMHLHAWRCAGLCPSGVRTRIPSTRRLGQWVSFAKIYSSVFDNKFPSLFASLSSWRCLAASTSYFLHAAINLRPPSTTVSTNASASNAALSKRPDVALYPSGPLFLPPAPYSPHCTLKVSEHDSLWQPPTAHSDERPRLQKYSRTQRCLNAVPPGYLKGPIVRGHPISDLLGCAPMMRSKTRWCTVRSLV